MEMGVHLPLMELADEGQSWERLRSVVDAARECSFDAISANDHFIFGTPWLDGPTALAAVVERSGQMSLATTVSLVTLRGPVPLAKALAALDILSEGRLTAGLGPGSSRRDYEAMGIDFEERWERFESGVVTLRALLRGERQELDLRPRPAREAGIPLWIGSWGSRAGLRRVARLADGWFASAYNTTPERFAEARALLGDQLRSLDKPADGFPNALVTMWTWITDDRKEADRVLTGVLAPLLGRDPEQLRGQVCIGSAEDCAELLSRYSRAGCQRVHLWPLGDERRQIEAVAAGVRPLLTASGP